MIRRTYKKLTRKAYRRCASACLSLSLLKPGKLRVEKVWAQLTIPVTNSLAKLYFHVDVGHHVHLDVGHHRIVPTLCEGLETLTEWKKCDGPTIGRLPTNPTD